MAGNQIAQLRRVHWRVRFLLVALVLVAAAILVFKWAALHGRVAGWEALGLVLVVVAGFALYDRDRAHLVNLFVRWPWVCKQLGMVRTEGEKTLSPSIRRLWASAHLVRLEYRARCIGLVPTDPVKLGTSLGFASGRVVAVRRCWRGERVMLEFRRSRTLPVQEVIAVGPDGIMPQVPGLPALALPGITTPVAALLARVSLEPPKEVMVCPVDLSNRKRAGVLVDESVAFCVVGFDHLPHGCRPHLYWDMQRAVSAPRWVEFAYGPSDEVTGEQQQPDGCRKYGGEVAVGRVHPTPGELVAMADDERYPMAVPNKPNRQGYHYECITAFRAARARRVERSIAPVAGTWRAALEAVSVGATASGEPWQLRLIDNHVLLAGITGAGKGSVLWSLICGLAPAVAAGAVELWGLDPKRVELAAGRDLFTRYAADPDGMLAMLEKAVELMQARGDVLAAQRQRRFEPSPEVPLYVIVIDELGYLTALLDDRATSQKVDRALNTLLTQGRALGFCLIGGLQDARKKVIDSRDMWPTRVAMRMPKALVDLVLGPGMYEAGAKCDQISRDAPGTAYVLDEQSLGEPMEVRASWVSDDTIRQTELAVVDWRSKAQSKRSRRVVRAAEVVAGDDGLDNVFELPRGRVGRMQEEPS